MPVQFAARPLNFQPIAGRPPKVAVLEPQSTRGVDIDGDGVGDISHAMMSKRIIQAMCPQADVKIILTGGDLDLSAKVFEALRVTTKPEMQFDAINISSGTDARFEMIDRYERPMKPGLMGWFRNRILNDLQNGNGNAQALRREIDALRRLAGKVPIYLAAGNTGPAGFSWQSLARNCQVVGATDARGEKASYSADHALVKRWAQGTYGVTKVAGGYDITGDDIPEVRDEEVSGGEPIVNRFVGKPAQEALVSDEEMIRIQAGDTSLLTERLFTPRQLVALEQITPAQAATLASFDYVAMLENGMLIEGFKVQDGRVVFDPDGSGRPNMVNVIWGTSFAAPLALAQDLNKRMAGETLNLTA